MLSRAAHARAVTQLRPHRQLSYYQDVSNPTRILVTTKGEAGYLHTVVGLDLRARYSLALDPANADVFASRSRAERAAAKAAKHFDRIEIEES